MAVDIYAEVTNRIISELERGNVPWRRPWDPTKCAGPAAAQNAATGHIYSGINQIWLGMHPAAFVTGDPRFCTYKQAQDKGWQVRKGEKSTPVVFYRPLEIDNDRHDPAKADSPATRMIGMLRVFSVFHTSQIDGVPPYAPPTLEEAPWRRPEAAQLIADNFGVPVKIGGDRAFYSPVYDFVQMPPAAAFRGPEYEAATLMHEFGHASGHPSRLARDLSGTKGSAKYATEEAIVDISAAMTCTHLGLPTDYENHAAYISHYIPALKADKRLMFRVAADAQRVTDYLLQFHPDYKLTHEAELKSLLSRPAPVSEPTPQ